MENAATAPKKSILEKVGIPPSLKWGFVGVVFFMLGSNLENSWFASYLTDSGLSQTQAGAIFTAFGVVVAISSWFSGIGVQIWGVRKIMWTGFIMFFVSSAPFLLLALPSGNYYFILFTYMFRGIAYPLFSYGFLVWITYRTKPEILARATSWFWTSVNLGLTVIGPWLSALLIPGIGETKVLWTGLVFVLIGGIFALVINKDQLVLPKIDNPLNEFKEGIAIMFKRPRMGIAAIVKTINDIGKFGFVVVLPTYLLSHGFTLAQWTTVWGSIFVINMFSNLLFGYIGDKLGWRKTVMYFGGTICGAATLLIYFVPQWFGNNFVIFFLAMSLYGIGLSAFGPLSALVPMMASDKKGAAVSVLNLGSGMSNFVGPAIVTILLPLGTKAVMFGIAIAYFLASILTYFLKTPEELAQK